MGESTSIRPPYDKVAARRERLYVNLDLLLTGWEQWKRASPEYLPVSRNYRPVHFAACWQIELQEAS
ncbi:MAG: hypothetical protein AAF597_19940, partial [Bacteroidota bacterium]